MCIVTEQETILNSSYMSCLSSIVFHVLQVYNGFSSKTYNSEGEGKLGMGEGGGVSWGCIQDSASDCQ